MAGLHLSDFTAVVGNPAKQFMWEVLIPALPVSSIKAISSQFPGVGSTNIELYYMGQYAVFPGSVEYDHIWPCTIIESEAGDVWNSMYEWRQLIHDQKTAVQADVAAFKRDITLTMLTSVGSSWARITLKQAWPKTIDALDLDKSSNTEAVRWSMQFAYDWWERAGV